MGIAELNSQYQCLRSELDAAYAVPEWNSSRIDRITVRIAQVELALASAQHANESNAGRERADELA
ncbi:MAG TPA: hypothetical protein VF319_13560 [Caldimonas sp.]